MEPRANRWAAPDRRPQCASACASVSTRQSGTRTSGQPAAQVMPRCWSAIAKPTGGVSSDELDQSRRLPPRSRNDGKIVSCFLHDMKTVRSKNQDSIKAGDTEDNEEQTVGSRSIDTCRHGGWECGIR